MPDNRHRTPGPVSARSLRGGAGAHIGDYRIHGTHDTRKIGRRSSDGCIGFYNEMIAELYPLVPVGTQVKLI